MNPIRRIRRFFAGRAEPRLAQLSSRQARPEARRRTGGRSGLDGFAGRFIQDMAAAACVAVGQPAGGAGRSTKHQEPAPRPASRAPGGGSLASRARARRASGSCAGVRTSAGFTAPGLPAGVAHRHDTSSTSPAVSLKAAGASRPAEAAIGREAGHVRQRLLHQGPSRRPAPGGLPEHPGRTGTAGACPAAASAFWGLRRLTSYRTGQL